MYIVFKEDGTAQKRLKLKFNFKIIVEMLKSEQVGNYGNKKINSTFWMIIDKRSD